MRGLSVFYFLRTPAGAFAVVLAAIVGVVIGGDAVTRDRIAGEPSSSDELQAHVAEQKVLQDGSDWLSEAYWARKRSRRLRERQQLGYFSPQSNPFSDNGDRRQSTAPRSRRDRGHYRTVCVRLCDGYYFPISFSTTRDQFGRDEQICRSKCASDVRLFYHPSDEPDAAKLKDRDGKLYEDLANAYVYRAEYKASCQCRPQPWTDEARQRHAMYATEKWQQNAARIARGKDPRGGSSKPWRVVRPNSETSASGEIETAAAGEGGPAGTRAERPRGSAREVLRSGRMGLGRVRRAPQEFRPRAIQRRERSWRSRVFNNIE